MAKPKANAKAAVRDEALSRARIVDAAIELLDAEGEGGLTFRALAAHLATGAGALYWHVENKAELLVAASDVVVARVLAAISPRATPKKALHDLALGVFDMIDEHPWVGEQLVRNPAPTAMLQIFERIGREVQALRAPRGAQYTAATLLGSYIISESRQNAANGRLTDVAPDRAEHLATLAAQWQALDAAAFPFTRSVAAHLREHDDRAELRAGVDLILAGIVR